MQYEMKKKPFFFCLSNRKSLGKGKPLWNELHEKDKKASEN